MYWRPSLRVSVSRAQAAAASIEVQSYEDLGDAIWYLRLGGTVVVPRSSLSTIEEAVHLQPPTPPLTVPEVMVPSASVPPAVRREDQPVAASQPVPTATYSVPALTVPWKQVGYPATTCGTVRILTGIALASPSSGSSRYLSDLLLNPERAFYGSSAKPPMVCFVILSKVCLADLLEIPPRTPSWRVHRNRKGGRGASRFVRNEFAS